MKWSDSYVVGSSSDVVYSSKYPTQHKLSSFAYGDSVFDNKETECVVVAIYPRRHSEAPSLWKAMSASGNISASFALQDSDVLPMFLTINIKSIHGSVYATWKYVISFAFLLK